jgi:tRNA nucleotidyltransferase/poly(A) polymerase
MNYSFVKTQVMKFNRIAKSLNLPKLYAVGGLCRDLVFSEGNMSKINDVDLTCCDGPKTTVLGLLLAKELGGSITYFNSHCSLFLDDVKYDFSSGFISDSVMKDHEDRFEREMLSRDFTIDALLLDLEEDTLIDVTKMGISDINKGLIRTIISPEESYLSDPKRAMRAIEMSTRFGFEIEKRSIDYFNDNYDLFNKFHNENSNHAINMIKKSIENNPSETLNLLRTTGFMYQVPLTGYYKDFIIANNLVEEYYDNLKTVNESLI